MAVRHGYGKIAGTDALVFAYDTGDTRNSYKGEPTVNQYTNPDFSNGTTGWTFSSWDGNISYTTATVPGPFGKDITALKLTKNNASAYSHFHQNNGGKYTTGNQYTLSAWVKGSGTLRGNTQWGGIQEYFALTGDWQYISYTVTAPNDSNYPYWAAEDITTGTVMYMAYAQSEQKAHATPFVNGTRSATQGLLDLTGNYTIDLSSTGFDSNAQPVFDGTNNHMSVGTGILSGTGDFTVEAVIQSDYTEVNGTIFANYPAGNLQTFFSGRYIGLYLANNSTYLGSSPFTTVLPEYTTDPIHFVAQREGTTTRVYLNGVLKKTGSSSSTIGATSAAFRVGANTNGVEDFLGDIFVVKVYNRALTEAEIRNNFNFHKSRFNI